MLLNISDLTSFVISCYTGECQDKLSKLGRSMFPTQVNINKGVNNLNNELDKNIMSNSNIPNDHFMSTLTPGISTTNLNKNISQSTIPDNNSELKTKEGFSMIRPKNLTSDSFLTRFRDHDMVNDTDMNDYQNRKVYLFVINFHHTKYKAAPFIRNTIYKLFAKKYPYDFDLFLIGPKENTRLKIYGNGLFSKGYYAYHSMKIAIELFPPESGYVYAGYFEANDDSCLQPTLLGHENHDRAMSEKSHPWYKNQTWMWNAMYNMNRTRFSTAFLNAVSEVESDSLLHSYCRFNFSQLHRGWGDFFYFPKSNLTAFLDLERVMYKHYVFLENAVPFIMRCIKANVIMDCNHGAMPEREVCSHLHPVKFSRSKERRICVNRIMNITLLEKPDTW